MIQARYYQTEAEYAVYDYFASGKTGNPIIAMPTGTGKSVVIGNFIRNLFYQWPNQRVMMLTHVKKLISQNAEKLQKIWPNAPIGIYSAGLNSRDTVMPILFGGIQSVAKAIKRAESDNYLPANMRHFGWRDLIIIDECHLLSPNESSMYQYTINELKKINPYLKIIGLSATPYRLKQGMLTDDGLFTDICYDITGVEPYNRLIAEGYISPLFPKGNITQIDVSNVGITAGEYNSKQLESAVDQDAITYSVCREMVQYGQNRRSWLMFASGIDNSEHLASMLQSFGIPAAACHSKLSKHENERRIKDFENGTLRCLTNDNMLTTGYDFPPIDLIGMVRPTISTGLNVQMWGRGTRPSPGKENCLGLDFVGNTPRLGPINDPHKPRKPGKGTGDAPVRICDVCGVYNHAAARFCCSCHVEFSFETKIFETAGNDAFIKSDLPITEYFDVKRVMYNLHQKPGSPDSIRVKYFCNLQMFEEWICLEHKGMAGKKARDWWRQRHPSEPPNTTREALQIAQELRAPSRIRVWVNRKFPEILSHEF